MSANMCCVNKALLRRMDALQTALRHAETQRAQEQQARLSLEKQLALAQSDAEEYSALVMRTFDEMETQRVLDFYARDDLERQLVYHDTCMAKLSKTHATTVAENQELRAELAAVRADYIGSAHSHGAGSSDLDLEQDLEWDLEQELGHDLELHLEQDLESELEPEQELELDVDLELDLDLGLELEPWNPDNVASGLVQDDTTAAEKNETQREKQAAVAIAEESAAAADDADDGDVSGVHACSDTDSSSMSLESRDSQMETETEMDSSTVWIAADVFFSSSKSPPLCGRDSSSPFTSNSSNSITMDNNLAMTNAVDKCLYAQECTQKRLEAIVAAMFQLQMWEVDGLSKHGELTVRIPTPDDCRDHKSNHDEYDDDDQYGLDPTSVPVLVGDEILTVLLELRGRVDDALAASHRPLDAVPVQCSDLPWLQARQAHLQVFAQDVYQWFDMLERVVYFVGDRRRRRRCSDSDLHDDRTYQYETGSRSGSDVTGAAHGAMVLSSLHSQWDIEAADRIDDRVGELLDVDALRATQVLPESQHRSDVVYVEQFVCLFIADALNVTVEHIALLRGGSDDTSSDDNTSTSTSVSATRSASRTEALRELWVVAMEADWLKRRCAAAMEWFKQDGYHPHQAGIDEMALVFKDVHASLVRDVEYFSYMLSHEMCGVPFTPPVGCDDRMDTSDQETNDDNKTHEQQLQDVNKAVLEIHWGLVRTIAASSSSSSSFRPPCLGNAIARDASVETLTLRLGQLVLDIVEMMSDDACDSDRKVQYTQVLHWCEQLQRRLQVEVESYIVLFSDDDAWV